MTTRTQSPSVHRTRHEEGDKLSQTVIDALAAVRGVDVTEMEPLHYDIDLDALDAIFEPRSNGPRRDGDSRVVFTSGGYEVAVYADGRIVISEIE